MARKNEELSPAKAQALLKSLRNQIDKLDLQLLKLINERAKLAGEIGQIKTDHGTEVFSPAREEEVYKNVLDANKGPLELAQMAGEASLGIPALNQLGVPLEMSLRTIRASVVESLRMQTSTDGGSSDSEQKLETVMPPRPAGPCVVTTATPAAVRRMASRNRSTRPGSRFWRLAASIKIHPCRRPPGVPLVWAIYVSRG